MLVYRDTTTIVLHCYRVVFIYGYLYMCAEACHGLVYGVINGFVHKMVQSLFAYVSYIHSGALAHCLQSFEHLNVTRGIVVFFAYFL